MALTGTLLKNAFTVWPIYIRCGLRWEKSEIFWIKKFLAQIKCPHLKKLKILNLKLEGAYNQNWSYMGKTPSARSSNSAVFLPARNLLLTTKAFLYLTGKKVDQLALATLKANPFPDGNIAFFRKLEKILSQSFKQKLKIRTPFIRFGKIEVIKRNAQFPIHLSSSCIKPTGVYHCGKCNKCAERMLGFRKAGLIDRTIYKKSGSRLSPG